MPKYNVETITADRKYSEFVYRLADGELVKVLPDGRGAPKQNREINGQTAVLTGILKYVVASTPRAAKAPKVEVPKGEVKRTTVKGDSKKTELVYADGSIVVPTGGRPRLVNGEGSPLVEIRTVVPGKVKGKKGRAKLPVEIVEVMENPRIEYVYGGVAELRKAGRGAPPKVNKAGKTLEKIVKYVLSENAPKPVVEKEEEVIIHLSEKGWKEGMSVRYKGGTKIGTVAKVNEDYLSVTFPGDKFLNPILPHKLEVVG